MHVYYNEKIAPAFGNILADLLYYPEYITSPRDMEVKEIKDCIININNPMFNIYTNEHRSSPLKYIAAELLWYFSGTNNPTFIEQYASLWKHIHNPDGTVNSAYGNLLFNEENIHGLTQYEWVIESLKRDKDTRQAFMHFNKPEHQWFGNKDQVCTLQALFHIRYNMLHMTITMRSNDVIYGFMTDWAFFSVLQYHVYLHLKEVYPDLRMGPYVHISHSMHLYERHYKLVEKMIKEPFVSHKLHTLSEPVLNEDGSCKEKYSKIFDPITKGNNPDFNIETGNELIDWCLRTLSSK